MGRPKPWVPGRGGPEKQRQLEISAAIDKYLAKRYPHNSEDYRQVLKSSITDDIATLESAIEKSAMHLERAGASTTARLRALRRCLKWQKTSKTFLRQWLCGDFSEREQRAVTNIAALPDAGELQQELYNVIGDYSAYVWGATALLTYAGLQLWRREHASGADSGGGTSSEYEESLKKNQARINALTEEALAYQAKQRKELLAAQEAARKAGEEAGVEFGRKEAIRRQAEEDAIIQAALDHDRRLREHKDRHADSFWTNPAKGVSQLTYAAQQLPAPILLALAAAVGIGVIRNPREKAQAKAASHSAQNSQSIMTNYLSLLLEKMFFAMTKGPDEVMRAQIIKNLAELFKM